MTYSEELLALDRQFCQDCQTGKEDAWASYFAEDGVMVGTGSSDNIVGKEAIKNIMAPMFALPELVFTWEPEHVEVSDDGTLGVTRGTSFRSYNQNGEVLEREGHYTTIWKRINNQWKIVWDIGN